MAPKADRAYKNILIVKLSAIGDVVHALPVAYALKQCFPAARITWVVEKPSYDLLANSPCIDEIIIFDKPRLKKLSGFRDYAPSFVRLLRSRRFDLALDLQALFKSGAIAFLSGAPERYVYCNTRELSDRLSRRVCGPNRDGHVVERYLDVVRAVGCEVKQVVFPIHITAEEALTAAEAARKAGLDIAEPYILLSPGANWPNKRWPTSLFAALADKLRQDGFIPVISGGPGDAALAAEITAAAAVPPGRHRPDAPRRGPGHACGRPPRPHRYHPQRPLRQRAQGPGYSARMRRLLAESLSQRSRLPGGHNRRGGLRRGGRSDSWPLTGRPSNAS